MVFSCELCEIFKNNFSENIGEFRFAKIHIHENLKKKLSILIYRSIRQPMTLSPKYINYSCFFLITLPKDMEKKKCIIIGVMPKWKTIYPIKSHKKASQPLSDRWIYDLMQTQINGTWNKGFSIIQGFFQTFFTAIIWW